MDHPMVSLSIGPKRSFLISSSVITTSLVAFFRNASGSCWLVLLCSLRRLRVDNNEPLFTQSLPESEHILVNRGGTRTPMCKKKVYLETESKVLY